MELVVTLVAGADGRHRLAACVAAVADVLPLCHEPDWLAPGAACDLAFSGDDIAAADQTVRAAIGGASIDVLAQQAAGRRKRLLVADMESTIIENEMLDELAEFVGMRDQVAEITRRAMNGELDFVAALHARVALLQGLQASVLDEAAKRIRLMPGARALLATMRRDGARCVLISGGFTVFAEGVAAELGFDRVVANRLDIVEDRIAGTVSPPIVTRDTKRETLLAEAEQAGLSVGDTLAIGDGANDLPMLQTAGLGIAFRAKPAVAAAARWRLDHADLSGVLYAQGYRAAEIIQG